MEDVASRTKAKKPHMLWLIWAYNHHIVFHSHSHPFHLAMWQCLSSTKSMGCCYSFHATYIADLGTYIFKRFIASCYWIIQNVMHIFFLFIMVWVGVVCAYDVLILHSTHDAVGMLFWLVCVRLILRIHKNIVIVTLIPTLYCHVCFNITPLNQPTPATTTTKIT